MRISYLVLTYNRKDDLKRCLDSIAGQDYPDLETVVVDNNSSDGTPEFIAAHYPWVKYHYVDYNSGVCQGRNIGFQQATGEIIVVIDDDSELPDQQLTRQIAEGFTKHPQMGVMALKVVNPKAPDTRRVIPSRDKSLTSAQAEVEVSYFPGGGSAFRREVLQEVGHYPGEYFYSMEELDMSYRIAKTNWQILYFPQLVVLHHESLGERPSWRRSYYDYRNRIWLATSFLPLRYLVVNLTVWGVVLFAQALRYGYAKHFFKGLTEAVTQLGPYRKRRKDQLLNREALRRLKRLHGRLYY